MTRIIVILLMILFSTPALGAVNVQLTAREILPSGATGKDRSNAPLSVGIPLYDTDGITAVSQLGLSGSTAAQFRPIAWYPSGNIKWVLVDTLATVSAGGSASMTLTGGTGNTAGSNLATDGTNIIVNTGSATFTIKKSGFNVFESVNVGGTQLVNAGNSGHVEGVGSDGSIYSSVNDSASTAEIEENGPVKAVVKAMGSLKSTAGARLMDYTLRMYFYTGSNRVKMTATMRNADKNYNDAVAFKSFTINIPVAIGETKTVTIGRKSGDVTRTITGTATMQQGYNTAAYDVAGYQANCYNWNPPVPGTCASSTFTPDTSYQGLAIQVGAETVSSFGTVTDGTTGIASLDDSSGKGMTVAMKHMAGYWPSAYTIADTGNFDIELFGKWNPKTNYMLFGKHETRELIFDFHTVAADHQAVLYELQYPLVAAAPFDYYRTTKAIYGQSELATTTEESNFFSALSPSRTAPSMANPAMSRVYRAFSWPQASGNNQSDFALADLVDYLRTGHGGYWARGEQRSRFIANAGLTHSDNWTTEQIYISGSSIISSQSGKDPGTIDRTGDGGISGYPIDMEHAHVLSVPLLYYLTGDEGLRESMMDYGEFLYRTQKSTPGWFAIPYEQGSTVYFRAYLRKLRNMAIAYEFSANTGSPQSTWATEVTTTLTDFLDSRDTVPATGKYNHGRNMDRGFAYYDCTRLNPQFSGVITDDTNIRVAHGFFHTLINFDAFEQVHRIIGDTGLS